jgi:uncharacterized membrane protein
MNTSAQQLHAWNDPANWSHRGLLGLYFNKQDTRLWVPKANPALGWTLNLAKPTGAALLLGALLLPTMVSVTIVIAFSLS